MMYPTAAPTLQRDVYTSGPSRAVRGTCTKCGMVKTAMTHEMIDTWWANHLNNESDK